MRPLIALVFTVLFGLGRANAQSDRQVYIPEFPADLDRVDLYLQTVDAGDNVYMAFGHTLLRVIDRVARTDIVYNWGVFDFDAPGFLWKFVRGDIVYVMAEYGMGNVLNTYRYERRSLTQDKLNLTKKQKEILIKRIIWNSQPENRGFVYQYYLENCSTKVRDHLDETLGGYLKTRFVNAPGSETLRQAIHRHFLQLPYFSLLTDIITNSDLELLMTQWQEMFLPVLMRKHLLTLSQVDDSGKEIPGTSLLTEAQAILTYPLPPEAAIGGFQAFFLGFSIPLLFAGLLLWSNRLTSIARRVMGLSILLWGMFAGAMGLTMVFLWGFTYHFQTYHSANLWLYWPTDFVFAWMGAKLLFSKQFSIGPKASKFFMWYIAFHCLCSLVFLALRTSGVIVQDVDEVLCYLVPITLLICVLIWRFVLCSVKNSKS